MRFVYVALDQESPCPMALTSGAAALFQCEGREMRAEFAPPGEPLHELSLTGPGDGHASVLIVYEAPLSPESGAVAKTQLHRVTTSDGSLLRAYLSFEVRLGARATLHLVASGLEDPENCDALREALRSATPAQVEGCLPVMVTPVSDEEVELANSDYVESDGHPTSLFRIRVPVRLWREALADLAAQCEGLIPAPPEARSRGQ